MSDANLYRFYARMSSAVLVKILLSVAGFFLGRYLDRLWGTEPYFLLAGFIGGVSLGLWWVVRTANAFENKAE
jgi:F0F1-type ATP synthase assembly protein I